MILLDYNSLLIALSFCSAGVALTFIVNWLVSQADRILMTWALGATFLVVSILAYSAFVARYSPTTGVIAFSALEIGLVFFLGAAYQFRTGNLPLAGIIAIALVANIATTVPMVLGYDGICYIVFNLAALFVLAATGWEYWRCRAESPLLITTLAVLYAIGGLSFGLCAFALAQDQSWIMNRPPDDWAENLNLVVCLADTAAIGALSLALNQIRLTRRHKRDAETDSLTGLFNRRAFFDRAASLRTATNVAVIVFDIDHFKQVNDIHGHQLGDAVLQRFATILKDAVRENDLAARLGGEEFCVLLPESSLKNALIVGERIRRKFVEWRFHSKEELFGSSVSIGISQIGACSQLDNLIIQADTALYVAKRSGRNRVVLFSNHKEAQSQLIAPPIKTPPPSPTENTKLYGAIADTVRRRPRRDGRLTRRN